MVLLMISDIELVVEKIVYPEHWGLLVGFLTFSQTWNPVPKKTGFLKKTCLPF